MQQPLTTLAGIAVVLSGLWLIGLAAAAVLRPDSVNSFFSKFASSAFAHVLEMVLRLIVGAAFVIYAPQMRFASLFSIFGWLLLMTTAVLLFVPWKVHRKFAERSLPMVKEWIRLFGAVSFLGGVFILYSYFFAEPSSYH